MNGNSYYSVMYWNSNMSTVEEFVTEPAQPSSGWYQISPMAYSPANGLLSFCAKTSYRGTYGLYQVKVSTGELKAAPADSAPCYPVSGNTQTFTIKASDSGNFMYAGDTADEGQEAWGVGSLFR